MSLKVNIKDEETRRLQEEVEEARRQQEKASEALLRVTTENVQHVRAHNAMHTSTVNKTTDYHHDYHEDSLNGDGGI